MLDQKLQHATGRTKYAQLRELLYRQILDTPRNPGDKLWTEADLVDSLGVSITTVRKAVDELVEIGLVERRVGKGTFLKTSPSLQPTTSTSSRVFMLGFRAWSVMLNDSYYGQILQGLDDTLRDADLQFNVTPREWGDDVLSDLREIQQQQPGCIIFPFSDRSKKDFILKLQTLNIPLLLLNHHLPEFKGPQICFDSMRMGQMAAKHLLERDHRQLAVIAGPESSPANITRTVGFCTALDEAGLDHSRIEVLYGSYSEMWGYQGAKLLLQLPHRPTAVYCCSDLIAYGAIKYFEHVGLSVPDDVAVMGSGGFRRSSLYYPNLTTLKMDCSRVGYLAGQWACHTLGREAPGWNPDIPHLKVPAELVVGDTT